MRRFGIMLMAIAWIAFHAILWVALPLPRWTTLPFKGYRPQIAPDNTLLVETGFEKDHGYRLLDIPSWRPIALPRLDKSLYFDASGLDSGGRWILAKDHSTNEAVLLQRRSGHIAARIPIGFGWPGPGELAPDGNNLIVPDREIDGPLHFWSLQNEVPQEVGQLEHGTPLASWSPNGRLFAVFRRRVKDSSVAICNPAGQIVREFAFGDKMPGRISWSPDSSSICYVVRDCTWKQLPSNDPADHPRLRIEYVDLQREGAWLVDEYPDAWFAGNEQIVAVRVAGTNRRFAILGRSPNGWNEVRGGSLPGEGRYWELRRVAEGGRRFVMWAPREKQGGGLNARQQFEFHPEAIRLFAEVIALESLTGRNLGTVTVPQYFDLAMLSSEPTLIISELEGRMHSYDLNPWRRIKIFFAILGSELVAFLTWRVIRRRRWANQFTG